MISWNGNTSENVRSSAVDLELDSSIGTFQSRDEVDNLGDLKVDSYMSTNSDPVESTAHLGWGSLNPETDPKGRHTEYGRRTTDLIGIFSIDMTIKLGSGVSCSPGDVGWLPCL